MEKEDLQNILKEINSKLKMMEDIRDELRRTRQAQENSSGLAPRFVESSPQVRTYGEMIGNLFYRANSRMPPTPFQGNDVVFIMGYVDQYLLNKLLPMAKQVRIISPIKTPLSKKNADALKRMANAGSEVRLHPMLHARLVCAPKRRFLIIGSGDIQTDCFGGSRFDAGVYSNNPELIDNAMKFFNIVWDESEPLTPTT